MARIVNPNTGGLSFESREDLSPQFDVLRPEGLKWGFELPRDVDFIVVLTRHSTAEDFLYTRAYLDGGADLLLMEGPGLPITTLNMFQDISEGNRGSLAVFTKLMRDNPINEASREFFIAMAEYICENRVPQGFLDPPISHQLGIENNLADDYMSIIEPRTYLKLITELGRERDVWALNNLKKIVDRSAPYVEGKRRKVVIARGPAHLRVLRALEYQCENFSKGSGCTVLASSFVLPSDGYDMDVGMYMNIAS